MLILYICMAVQLASLFPDAPAPRLALPASLPSGFNYWRDFLTLAEEAELLAEIQQLELKPSQYHEYTALRKTASFGLPFGRGAPAERPRALLSLSSGPGFASPSGPRPPAPGWLVWLADKVAQHVGRAPGAFPHALVTEYPPGAPIGWHRDAPPFAAV